MTKSKIIEFIQTDSSISVDSIIRGLSCLYTSKQESVAIVDLRSSKSNVLWSLYDKKNIKYIDDIISVVSQLNLTMFKTYFNLKSDVVCVKNIDFILEHKHLLCFFELISQIYNNVIIATNFNNINKNSSLLNIATNICLCCYNNPISVEECNNLNSKIALIGYDKINILSLVFSLNKNHTISNKNTVVFPFSFDIQKEITNTKFLFNDNTNPFVLELNKFEKSLSKEEVKNSIEDSIYEQQYAYLALKERLHSDLIKILNNLSDDKIRENINIQTDTLLKNYEIQLPLSAKQKLIKELCDDIAGFGVLEDFINDSSVTEIMVNGLNNIYVEKNGKITETNIKFQSLEKLKIVIDKIASAVGRHIDEASPIVDARLKDGSRVNAVISPIVLDGHTLTIRKFSKNKLQAEDLISYDSINKEMIDFLKNCVEKKKNILISGGTGTGKTTLLNVISSFIGNDERIITIEDSAELQLNQKHVIRLETRARSIEGTAEITIRQLVINSLRMRPDRIIVGECRAGETLDMLQAMNTGHNGSMTTVHSNSPQDAISRLLVMSLMSGIDLPEKAIISMIVSAINIIVQIKRYSDGSRKISEISILKKTNDKQYEIVPVFVYNEQSKLFENFLEKT